MNLSDAFPSPWTTQPERKFDKFMRGLASVGARCTALSCGSSDQIELRMGDWVRTVDPTWWQVDDPFGSGQQIGREMLAMQPAPQAFKSGQEPVGRSQGQPTLDRLEAALADLEAAVARLKAATEALRQP